MAKKAEQRKTMCVILCNATLYRFDFEKPEVLFSESTPLVYQFYFGLDPLGPTDEQQEVTTISQVSSISHFFTH